MTVPARVTVLLAHGSRDPAWRRPIEAVAAAMRAADPDAQVRCAYLEHDVPDLADALDQAVATGAGQVVIVPLFLGVGRHVREDLPRLLQSGRDRHPGLALEMRPSVGEDARVTALLAAIAAS